MPRPIIFVSESFQAAVNSTRHRRNAAIRISVEARDASANNPVRVLVLRLTKEDGSAKPETREHSPQSGNHGRDHPTSAPLTYTFPAKNSDCTQKIVVLAWHKNEMIQSPNPANVEVRHLALTFEG
jgi:hypothetical protein